MSNSKAYATTLKRVKGLTGREKEVVLRHHTFCRLCKRRLSAGEAALSLGMLDKTCELFIHTNCAITQFTKIHSKTFREDVKKKSPTKRTRTTQPKVFVGDGKVICQFCGRIIREPATYIRIGKKTFHNEGTNSCATRYRRVVNATKNSLN